MRDVPFVPLHARSDGSLLGGASSVRSLIDEAVRCGYDTLALADENSLITAVPFFEEAHRQGIRPILGATLDDGESRVVALVESELGHTHLCRLISRLNLGLVPPEGETGTLPEALAAGSGGLHLLASSPRTAARLLEAGVARDHLTLELVRPGSSATLERDLREASESLGLPLAASLDAWFARPRDHSVHAVLRAIRERTTLRQLTPGQTAAPERHLRPLEEVNRLFRDLPAALARASEIAGDCRFDLLERGRVFPAYPVPDGETAHGLLERACEEGLRKRYGEAPPLGARDRLGRELALIEERGIADYFLIVRDIVGHSRDRGVPVAGRGSGASSLVAYVLGITNVCPLQFSLTFERFLHEDRQDLPDLDVDFCWRIRDEVIDSVFETFGRDRVAMVSTHVCFQPRSAFREAARVVGLPDEAISRLRSRLPADYEDRMETSATLSLSRREEARLPIEPDRLATILDHAKKLVGLRHHLSVHPGGILLTPDPIDGHTPLQRSDKGVVISQHDKDGVEAVGLVKIDLLGNRALSTVRESLDLIEAEGIPRPEVESLPAEDEATLSLLERGDTVGCNQLESPAMRRLLIQMKPRSIPDVMQTLALIRPGAASLGMKEAFIRRRHGEEPWVVPHPSLDAFLSETYGVMLYEDDAILVTSALTGCSLGEGDRFRRRVQKCRTDAEREELSRTFLEQCGANGVADPAAREILFQMAKFNSYSFCKSHAASYALLAYATAWLKAHHPAAFWVAALNNNQGLYEKRVYLEEARRTGIELLGPCVNTSSSEFTLENGRIRTGLGLIHGLQRTTVEGILARRTERPFASLGDLLVRVRMTAEEATSLIRAGALDFTGRTRPHLLLETEIRHAGLKRAAAEGHLLLTPPAEDVRLPAMPELDDAALIRDEIELLGFTPRTHPLAALRGRLPRCAHAVDSRALPLSEGRRVTLFGLLDAARSTQTRGGRTMEFLTLEDEYGIFECTLFPGVHRRTRTRKRSWGPYLVTGRVERDHGALTLETEDVRLVSLQD